MAITAVTKDTNWLARLNANDATLDTAVTDIQASQVLNWVDLPLVSGVSGNLRASIIGKTGAVAVTGQVIGTFLTGSTVAKVNGTPLEGHNWSDIPVITNTDATCGLQIANDGTFSIIDLPGGKQVTQINVNGIVF